MMKRDYEAVSSGACECCGRPFEPAPDILEARRRAASRPANPLSKERILLGLRDNGELVKDELKKMRREALFRENGIRHEQ